MALISQTSLKDLKYGNDQPGGGNSGQPYITHPIPLKSPSNIDDGLIRGGFLGATKASFVDTVRIGKFLKDRPKGPLFIAKQIGLQLSNPKLETKNDVLGKLMGAIGSTRIYNGGINTLAQIPVTAFGGHIVRHGLLPIHDAKSTYGAIVKANDAPGTYGKNNRLVKLIAKLKADPNADIDQYIGGPDSFDGIGQTTIRRYYNGLNISPFIEPSSRQISNINYYNTLGVSRQYFENDGEIFESNNIATGEMKQKPSQIDQTTVVYSAAGRSYNAIKSTIETQTERSRLGMNFQASQDAPSSFTYSGKSKYKDLPLGIFNIENRLGLNDNRDQINLTPLFTSDEYADSQVTVEGQTFNIKDLIKFRIEAVDGDNPSFSTWMIFRAYLKGISDTPNPSWDAIKYIGRGESFFTYTGVERNISFNFQVAALSQQEMEPMWQKLNYLYSNTMPDYSNNIMRAPYIKLTLGDYIFRQPGIIKSLTYSIDDNSPWEVNLENGDLYELPHVLNVQMTFAPIHDFLPAKFPQTYNGTLPSFVGGDNEGTYVNNKIPESK